MKRIIIGVFVFVNVVAVLMLLLSSGGGFKSLILTKSENPKIAVKGFFDCLSEGRYEDSCKYISGYSSLGLETISNSDADAQNDDITAYILENLLNSYNCELIDSTDMSAVGSAATGRDYSVSGGSAQVTFLYTVFDNAKFTEALGEQTKIAYEKSLKQGEELDSENALALVDKAFSVIKDVPGTEYYTTREFTVQLTRSGEEWLLVLTQELYNALMGDLPAVVSDSDVTSGSDLSLDSAE